MLAGEQAFDLRQGQHRWHELRRDVPFKQPVAVVTEHGRYSDRLVHRQPDEPAEQQVVVHLLHQLPFRAHRVDCLQQQRTQQLLRWERGRPTSE